MKRHTWNGFDRIFWGEAKVCKVLQKMVTKRWKKPFEILFWFSLLLLTWVTSGMTFLYLFFLQTYRKITKASDNWGNRYLFFKCKFLLNLVWALLSLRFRSLAWRFHCFQCKFRNGLKTRQFKFSVVSV